jgi:hypothetical protein
MMISKLRAFSIAGKAMAEKQSRTKYEDFSELELIEENNEFWTFGSGSDEMYGDGHIPGGFFVHISKRDGHILSREEEACYYQEKAQELQAA